MKVVHFGPIHPQSLFPGHRRPGSQVGHHQLVQLARLNIADLEPLVHILALPHPKKTVELKTSLPPGAAIGTVF